MTFKNLIKNKNISYVPIYSMFSHETGKIDLCCDGNVNRWISNFYNVNRCWKSLKVLLPKQENCKDWNNEELYSPNFEKFFNIFLGIGSVCSKDEPIPEKMNGIVYYEECDSIKINAGYQRGLEFAENVVDKVIENNPDIAIVEGQQLVYKLIDKVKNSEWSGKIVYWCPVCATNKKSRTFLEKDKELNEQIFNSVDYIIIVAKDQKEYLKELGIDKNKIIYLPKLIDRSTNLFEYSLDEKIIKEISSNEKIIYLPFRLSDEGYRIWDIIKTYNKSKSNYKIYAPNVNDTSLDELKKICNKFDNSISELEVEEFFNNIKYISSNRDTYYSIIDNCENVIIPYFEDYNFVMHAAVDELVRDKNIKCKVALNPRRFLKEIKNEH